MNGLRRCLWVALAAAVVVVLAACSGSGPDEPGTSKGPRATSTPSVPANEQAADGPLVGDSNLIDGEQSCAADEGNAPWYPTIAAFEVHDSGRTHLYNCAHFTGSMSGGNQVIACSSPQDYITPYNIVDHGPNELFIYGGGYGDNPAASGSFVARVEPGTFNQVWRRVRGTSEC